MENGTKKIDDYLKKAAGAQSRLNDAVKQLQNLPGTKVVSSKQIEKATMTLLDSGHISIRFENEAEAKKYFDKA